MHINELIVKKLLQGLSEEEESILQRWLKEDPSHDELYLTLSSGKELADAYRLYSHHNKKSKKAFHQVWHRLQNGAFAKAEVGRFRKMNHWTRVAAAVIIPLLVVSAFVYIWTGRNTIKPGETKALLTLASGDAYELNGNDNERWFYIGGTPIARESSGAITYHVPDKISVDIHNTLSVPRGGEYHLTLSDGTVIHLNSSSVLKYPVVFTGDKRVVDLSGEAYFKVAKDSLHPFIVRVHGVTVQQFGTEFNIKSRSPEEVQVALVEGSIGIRPPHGDMHKLHPGELAVWNADNAGDVLIQNKDLLPHVAWHSGRYVFYNESLKGLMDELSLWYDLDVKFKEESLEQLHFTGSVHRYDDISVILRAISETVDVDFNISGNSIVIDRK